MDTTDISDTLAKRYGLTLTLEEAHENPHMVGMPEGSTHWLVRLINTDDERDYMEVPFSQGPALTKPPTLYDVLSCLVSDANMVEAGTFDDFERFCDDLGYDNDSLSAFRLFERTHRAVIEQTESLRHLLGVTVFDQLLEDEEVQ